MATTLTTDNIVEVPDRTAMTTVEDTDNFLVYDVSEDIIKKITKAYLQETLGMFGQGQRWHNYYGIRQENTTYWNETDRPVYVSLGVVSTMNNDHIRINDHILFFTSDNGYLGMEFMLFPGEGYRIECQTGTIKTIFRWLEYST